MTKIRLVTRNEYNRLEITLKSDNAFIEISRELESLFHQPTKMLAIAESGKSGYWECSSFFAQFLIVKNV